ncbi:acidic leucine-rich nuclear phosphoprotein 32 family member B-like [Zingiber officinale]|uniref:Ribosomal protein S6 n=1 Tax=Zingiber officinale TaxID=94328 RepID=A0A8J5M1R2_ZINOF|nr:acidic leucine-rich nuclear phosphoprotein 32 family member B-like [Zingiber officinale]KAG6531821.1 hypothetical protein ZIOFF_005647 [Zingiber officinale]
MVAARMTPSSSSSFAWPRSFLFHYPQTHEPSSRNFPLASSLKRLSLDVRNSRRLVTAGAKKKKNKIDSHSFYASPEEATGPFPEAVLLKKKTVTEDGRVLPEFADVEEEKLYEFLSLQLESDLNLERMRHYEVVYLIHEDHADEVDNVISKVQEFVREKKGRIWRLNNWGLRQLAYKIKKATHANYVLMNFEIDAKFVNDFKSMLDKDERIIRHLVMKRDEAVTEDCPPPLEYHTLRSQQEEADDEDDDLDSEDDDWDDDMELEMAGQDDFDVEADDNIIIINSDDKEDDTDDSAGTKTMLKTSKAMR